MRKGLVFKTNNNLLLSFSKLFDGDIVTAVPTRGIKPSMLNRPQGTDGH